MIRKAGTRKEVRSERRTEPRERGMSDWQKTTVGEVASGFLSGGTPSTSRADFWEGEIPWITSKWLGDKLELTTGEKVVSEEAVKNTATKIVPKDSIIFATRVGVGKVGINRIDLAINQDLAGVLIDNERYDIKFLAYQLGIDSIQQYVAMNKRGATIKGITRDCLEQISDLLPVLDTGEALVVGDASLLPTRVRIQRPKSEPNSGTVPFWDKWSEDKEVAKIADSVASWRKQANQGPPSPAPTAGSK